MRLTFLCSLVFAALGHLAQAQQMPATAISPDGATLLVAGDNRVIYTLDAATLAVTSRRYLPEQVEWMTYSQDGETIFMRTQARTFSARSAGSFKERFGAEKVNAVSYAPEAGRILLMENNYKGGILRLLAASSGKNILKMDLPELRTDEVVLSDDGASALILTNSENSDTEEKAQPGSDLKGFAKYDFRQRHDGYISKVIAVDLAAGTFAATDTWYRVSNPTQLRMLGGNAVLVKSVSDTAVIQPDGSTTMIDLGEKYASFVQISADGQNVYLASNNELRIHALNGTAVATGGLTIQADRQPGPAERVTSMAEAGDGTLYLATSAYRILKVSPGATSVTAVPVF